MKYFKPNDFIVARWLAIAGAAGAAIAQAIAYYTTNSYWNTVAFVAALLSAAAVAGLWRAVSSRNSALVEAVQESDEQQRVMQQLHRELEIHRNLERELVEARQAAESAVMAKGEFLATMSHEIRTPLNGIIPMLDLLMTSKLTPDQQDFLRTAYTSSRQMLRIVDDILDFSKLEANKLQLETTALNLRELLDSIIRLLEKPAENKGLRLNLQLDPGVRLALRGDPVRLRQILTNLVSNALKFTERGSITVVVTRKSESRTQHELRFEIRDTGIGISKENLGNLFCAFAQADASTTRLYGGTGLGLVICKRIVDLMGGTIGVDSELGRGSTFWFEVPLLKAVGDMQGQRADLNGGRILLLTADAALRQRMQSAAQAWGAQLADCETTQDALAKLRSAQSRGSNWAINLLMVDLNSVRSTTIALHRNLQRSAEFESLPVVYLKGQESPPPELSEGQQVLILSRTMGSAEMRTAISTFIATPPVTRINTGGGTALSSEFADIEPPVANEAAATTMKGRVLLVEDNPINQKVAQSLIKLLGLECETAEHGDIAIEKMRVGDIDLVLMDCQMPVKDGYTATTEWRLHEAANNLSPLPIIAMTANAMAGDRQKCLDSGMDDYLSKPVDRRLLEASLALWLQRSPRRINVPRPTSPSRTTTAAVPQPGASQRAVPFASAAPAIAPASERNAAQSAAGFAAASAAPAPAAASPAGPTAPVLEMEVVEELRSIMGAEYQGLVKLFLEDAPLHIERLRAAAAGNDIAAMVAPAHTLKSSSANLGALALSSVAKRIEFGARTESLPKPSLAVLMLENEFRRAKAALAALDA